MGRWAAGGWGEETGAYRNNGVKRGQWGAKAPFVSGQLLMNAPMMVIVPAEQFFLVMPVTHRFIN